MTVPSDVGRDERAAGRAPVLSVRGLRIGYTVDRQTLEVVRGVDFTLGAGETLGVVGESGSGKSTLVLSLVGLLADNGRVLGGKADFEGVDLLALSSRERRPYLGARIGVVYQDALPALNPVMRIGRQIEEVIETHDRSQDARSRGHELLAMVQLPDPPRMAKRYPHELSGGMRQRALIATGMAMSPALLIADEPTTALDVTIQAQVLDLIRRIAAETSAATIVVTHDMGVIASLSDRVLVMYAGKVVEMGTTREIFSNPQHPYTISLLKATPRPDMRLGERLATLEGQPPRAGDDIVGCAFVDRCFAAEERCHVETPPLTEVRDAHFSACLLVDTLPQKAQALDEASGTPQDVTRLTPLSTPTAPAGPLVEVSGLARHYRVVRARIRGRTAVVKAVDGVDLSITRGEWLGLVGESGCGKSTLGRMLVGLERPDSGQIIFDGQDVAGLKGAALAAMRRRAQMVFQDPRSSLNRRMTVRQIVEEAVAKAGVPPRQRLERAQELLELVGLDGSFLERYPLRLSGGEAQRVAIARAIATEPDLIVADEAVSSLDVSIQGQILNLLSDLGVRLGIGMVFISHDLAVVRQVCSQTAVMYLGTIVESGDTADVFAHPTHPYTAALLSAIPVPDPERERAREHATVIGDIADPTDPPQGCLFHPRCPIGPSIRSGREVCREQTPVLEARFDGRLSACHFAGEPVEV